jgi:hypothetical protein
MGLAPRPTPEQWERFRTCLFAQLRELLTGYGPIDLLWFDGGWERSADEWRTPALHDLMHLLQRPYDTVSVRGLPIRHVRAVRELRSGTALAFRTRCAVVDQLFNADPNGELIITVPEALIDPLATVLEVELDAG